MTSIHLFGLLFHRFSCLLISHTINNFCRQRIQDESGHNTELRLTMTKLENYIKELENKIEIFKTKELNQANYDFITVIYNNLSLIILSLFYSYNLNF